jgi:hypothetical protein
VIADGPVVDAARIRTVFEKLLPERNLLLMQIYADVTSRTF